MEMLPRGNLRMGAALCLLLLALLHEATGQRRRPGRRNYNRVENGKDNGNSSGKANTRWRLKSITESVKSQRLLHSFRPEQGRWFPNQKTITSL